VTDANACTDCGTSIADVRGARCTACESKIATLAQEDVPHRGEDGLPEPGRRFGPYRIVKKLGAGGMGAVYEAEHVESGRRVALKVLVRAFADEEMRKRFLREGRLAAQVNHPNTVYVYGTEEVAGDPVITMELVEGGTLDERVEKSGPLPYGEAVEAILQAAAGLEAAAAIGVLHRDVKPTNCFLDADGTVKVGDFGLSVATGSRKETQLTQTGVVMGTPAFASPEQLRGDPLDVRSDIYSLGATLYYLLTGKVPHDAENVVKLIAHVLDKPAASPAAHRPGLPRDLCRAVLRCLEKKPEARFRTYDEMRQALLPFTSSAPSPATLGLRFGAGVLDYLMLSLIGAAANLAWGMDMSGRSGVQAVPMTIATVLYVLYYAVLEGVWGSTAGKAICGLRVVDAGRGPAGFGRALLRASIYVAIPFLPIWIASAVDPMTLMRQTCATILISQSWWMLMLLLFSTMRRRNGFAGMHDVASGTRVVQRSAYAARPLATRAEQAPARGTATSTLGPYALMSSLHKTETHELLLGWDAQLQRRVWIRRLPDGAEPTAGRARSGRLRWLNGRRLAGACWDAYEAVSGEPLERAIRTRQPWEKVRFWLLDLAQELQACAKDGAHPPLGFDRVWITREGRAKLLDFPAPGAEDATTFEPPLFLWRVAEASLDPRLPLHAREFVDALPGLEAGAAAERLKALVARRVAVTRRRKLAVMAALGAFPAMTIAFMFLGLRMMSQWEKELPDLWPAAGCVRRHMVIERMEQFAEEREALEAVIAGKYRKLLSDPAMRQNPFYLAAIPDFMQQRADRILATRTEVSAEELAAAEEKIKPMLQTGGPSNMSAVMSTMTMVGSVMFLVLFVAGPSLACALIFKGGPVLRLFDLTFVTADGREASRGRLLFRALAAWSPALVAFPAVIAIMVAQLPTWTVLLLHVPLVAGAAWAVGAERSLQDRTAGVWMVRR